MTATTAAREPAAGALIGRRFELAELTAALDSARTGGRGRLFLLTGDAGIGKTRLLEAAAEAAESTGTTVVWGRCWEGGGAPPYWPWSQVVRSLLGDGSDGVQATQADDCVQATQAGQPAGGYPAGVLRNLAELVPELAADHDRPRATTLTELPGARLAIFDAVKTVLQMRSAEGGLLVALDDLHAADEASLRLLQFVARESPSGSVVIVGTYRDPEVRSSPALHQLMSAIARQGRRITLPGLDEDSVGTLLERTPGGARMADHARAIHNATDGNPFFVQEVGRLLAAEHVLARDMGQTGRVPVPEEVHALIRRRLEPLPADVRDALTLASVLGRTFELSVLAPLTEQSTADLLDVLARARDFDVVEDAGLGRWQFSHALLREALYDDLRPSQRVVLHRRAGEAIEKLAGDDPGAWAPRLAHHFFETARGGDGARAVRYCALAAEQAMATMAFEEAAVQHGRALEALAIGTPVDERARYDLLVGLAQAQQRAGDLALARETYQRAVKSARALASPELLARAAIGYTGFIESKADDTRSSVLEEALAALPPGDDPLRARVLVLLGQRTQVQRFASPEASKRNWQRGRELAWQGVEMARRVADPETLRAVLWDWHFAAANYLDTLEERMAVADELVQLALDAGDPERLVLARQWRGMDLYALGHIDAMAAEMEQGRQEAEELRMPFLLWGIVMEQAGLAILRGELDEAERLAAEALAAGERAEFADVEGAYRGQRAEVLFHQGRFDELVELLRPMADSLGPNALDCSRIWVGMAMAHAGRMDEARHTFEHQVAALVPERFVRSRLCCPVRLADLAFLIGAEDGLQPLYDTLLPHAGSHVAIGVANFSLGACDRSLGQVATLMGRFDEAESHFEAAHKLHARLGARAWDAHTRAHHSQMLLRRGGSGDGARAEALAEQARQGFSALGMTFYEQRVLGPPDAAPAVDHSGAAARLTQEGEYWGFHYEGHVARLRDSKGLRYLARLLRNPGQELHALDLVVGEGRGEDPSAPRQLAQTGSGDAGVMLDPQAKAEYRRRLEDLREDLDEATAYNDVARAARAQEEMEFLIAELSAAVGLGGRDRKAASDAERARQSVTRAIKGTVERLAEAHPALGNHLRSTVRTGIYSAYVPDPRAPITWDG